MNTEQIINLLRTAIELTDAFTDEEYKAMCNFLDRLERLGGDVLDEDDRPFPKIF